MEEQRDEKLWQIAKSRADFENNLIGFVVITAICRAVWFFTSGQKEIHGTPGHYG